MTTIVRRSIMVWAVMVADTMYKNILARSAAFVKNVVKINVCLLKIKCVKLHRRND